MVAEMESDDSLRRQREYYNRRWSEQDYISKGGLRRAAAILDLLAQTGLKRPRILDFGCGTGWLASVLSSVGPTTGFDLSDEAIRKAGERWPWIDFSSGDACEAGFEQSSFEVIVSQEVIEHIEEQAKHLEQIARFLIPGGYLILTTPNAFAFRRMTPKVRRRWKDQPIEKRLFKRELRTLLEPEFEILASGSTGLGHSSRGIYRLIHAKALRSVLKRLRALGLWQALWERLGFGLHFHLLAKKKR